jgi:uncharacterized tellurite resistance protein B-like protein
MHAPARRRSTEQNLGDRTTREVIGGALRPADPRRFLVEAMLCAMNVDGNVDPRELAVLERHIAEHDLFQGVSESQARTMIELATDAMRFAASPVARIPAIARGLPSRIHRLTAYAMACEVVKADQEVAPAELAFLDLLRQHLRVSAHEGVLIMAAVEERRLGMYLDQRVERIRALVPAAIELFALRAHARGRVDDAHRVAVKEFFLTIPDLAAPAEELEAHLRVAFTAPRPSGFAAHRALGKLAESLPDPVDRWWLTVYAIAAEPRDERSWRRTLFAGLLQYAFGLRDDDMDLAAADAQIFPSSVG